MNESSFDEMRTHLLDAVEAVGHAFTEPDDDWIPIAWVEGDKPAIMMLDLNTKEMWPAIFEGPIRKMKPTFVGLVVSVWTADRQTLADVEEGPAPSEDPDRKEAVVVEVSDGQRHEIWKASIARSEDGPPTLGEWDNIQMTEYSGMLAALPLRAFESWRSERPT